MGLSPYDKYWMMQTIIQQFKAQFTGEFDCADLCFDSRADKKHAIDIQFIGPRVIIKAEEVDNDEYDMETVNMMERLEQFFMERGMRLIADTSDDSVTQRKQYAL